MKKQDLVRVALTELGMDLADAQANTVPFLREKIRIARASKNPSDPLAKPPKGLARMSLEELRENVRERDLTLNTDHTRVQLQIMIQDDVFVRIMRSTPEISQMVAAAASTNGEDFAVDMDFEVLEEEAK